METSMAEIVVLNRWRDQQRRKPEIHIGRQETAETAQLMIFTGVRYERLETVPPQRVSIPVMLLEQN
jgi:hypothetical protein